MGIQRTRSFRGPTRPDIEILRSGVPLSAHENRHILGGADDIDAALNALAIALTAQGDVVYHAAAVNTLARLVAGTIGHYFGTGGPGANPSWMPPEWILYSSDALANAATWDKSSLPAHDLWFVRYALVGTGAVRDLEMRLNNVAGAVYREQGFDWSVPGLFANIAQTELTLTQLHQDWQTIGEMMISGREMGGDQMIGVIHHSMGYSPNLELEMHGGILDTNADLNRITIWPTAGTITGDILLYYMDF